MIEPREAAGDPVVSVVLPTYDRARLLPEALQSALDQTFAALEVIVVDDGSTDDTASVVAAFTDPRIRSLRQAHGGIAAARNRALRAARGRYVAFLDSDDRWLPEMLATLVPTLDARPEVAIVHGRSQAMDVAGRLLPQHSGGPLHLADRPVASLLCESSVPVSAALVRRSCLGSAGPCDETLPARIDWDLWIRLAMRGDIVFVDRVLAHYREHEGRTTSLRSARSAEVIGSRVQVLDAFFGRPDVPPEAQAVRRRAYRNAHVEATVQWLACGRWREARRSLRAAMAVGRLRAPARVLWVVAGVPGRRLRRRLAVHRASPP